MDSACLSWEQASLALDGDLQVTEGERRDSRGVRSADRFLVCVISTRLGVLGTAANKTDPRPQLLLLCSSHQGPQRWDVTEPAVVLRGSWVLGWGAAARDASSLAGFGAAGLRCPFCLWLSWESDQMYEFRAQGRGVGRWRPGGTGVRGVSRRGMGGPGDWGACTCVCAHAVGCRSQAPTGVSTPIPESEGPHCACTPTPIRYKVGT